jgi:hypothetical protein
MQRVVRWIDIDGGRNGRNRGDVAFSWEGSRLRPTGVVVFATLDRRRYCHDAVPTGEPESGGIGAPPLGALRLVARRSAAWLLGR